MATRQSGCRARHLHAIGDRVKARDRELAEAITTEMGKTIGEATGAELLDRAEKGPARPGVDQPSKRERRVTGRTKATAPSRWPESEIAAGETPETPLTEAGFDDEEDAVVIPLPVFDARKRQSSGGLSWVSQLEDRRQPTSAPDWRRRLGQ